MNLLNNINKDTEFQKVLRHFSNYNTYKIEKIYNIYNILNNFNFQNDIILIFNKIIKELNDDNTIDYLKTKDEVYLSKIFSYLQIIKNVKMYSNQNNQNNIYRKYIELELNFWKYKLISKEKYEEIMNLIYDLNSKDDDIYKVYLYLWNKFLDPTKERIILRKPNYYVDYMLSDISLLKIVNEEIINSYILNILSTNKIKNIEDKIDLNISSSELFFMLVNNYI